MSHFRQTLNNMKLGQLKEVGPFNVLKTRNPAGQVVYTLADPDSEAYGAPMYLEDAVEWIENAFEDDFHKATRGSQF